MEGEERQEGGQGDFLCSQSAHDQNVLAQMGAVEVTLPTSLPFWASFESRERGYVLRHRPLTIDGVARCI